MPNANVLNWAVLLNRREQAVRQGHLILPDAMSEALNVPRIRLQKMLRRGELFAIYIEGRPYIPSFLVADDSTKERLWELCKILYPAPAEARLAWLHTARASTWNLRPVDCLHDANRFRCVRLLAKAWASEWSRTVVSVYPGETLEGSKTNREPLYRAVLEIDPRMNLWSRVIATVGANERWDGRAPVGRMMVSVYRLTPPNSRLLESALILTPADTGQSVAIQNPTGATYLLPLPVRMTAGNVPGLIRHVAEHMRGGVRSGGMTLTEAANVLDIGLQEAHGLVSESRLERVDSHASHRRGIRVTVGSVRSLRLSESIRSRAGT
ncbi:hypothetical protein [Caballeronia sp. LZ032]|uniref:hypothetical protein n=1 Tax=Caballeronia sp. LZ032 TaxID=3038565 RepID=UPI0028587F53|nr:hypothetical protein [Caballeronia sp. LZ032]MDR5879424.1 hypothetical protein [Caballeronia sp. LZ032]